jgi:hypothetical protein
MVLAIGAVAGVFGYYGFMVWPVLFRLMHQLKKTRRR